MSCDLQLEQVICLTKELLHNLGVNLNEDSGNRESKAIAFLEKILEKACKETFCKIPSGHHKNNKKI